jgi:hypothetical protein
VSNFFPTRPIKLKLGLQANTWETTNRNPLAPIKLSIQVVDSVDLSDETHPRFPMQGHILNIGGGDVLISGTWADMLGLGIKSIVCILVYSWYLCGYVSFYLLMSLLVFFSFKKIPMQIIDWLTRSSKPTCCLFAVKCQAGKFWSQFEFWNFAWVKQKPTFNEAHCHWQFQSGGKEQ